MSRIRPFHTAWTRHVMDHASVDASDAVGTFCRERRRSRVKDMEGERGDDGEGGRGEKRDVVEPRRVEPHSHHPGCGLAGVCRAVQAIWVVT